MLNIHRPEPASVLIRDDFDSSRLRHALIGLVTVKVAGLVLLVDPTGADPLVIKSVFSSGTAIVLAALLALTLFRFGGKVVPRSSVHVAVALVAAVALASTLFAENSYIALFGERQKYHGLVFLADMLTVYCAVAVSFRRAADWGSLAIAMTIVGLLSLGYTVAQRLGRDALQWAATTTTPVGTFGHADALGQFVSILFGGALGAAAFPPSRAWPPRAATVAVAIIAFAMAIALAPRGSLLGFGAALGVAPLVALKLRGLGREAIEAHMVRALVVVTLLTGLLTISPLAPRLRDAVSAIDVVDRALLYESALSAVADRPVLGFGPDNFAVAYPRYRQPRSEMILGEGLPGSTPSWPLQVAATHGLVGLFAWLILIGIALRSLWSRGLTRAPAIAAPVLLATVSYWTHGAVAADSIATDWWPWVAFGTAAALERIPSVEAPARRRLPGFVIGAGVAAALISALSGTAALRSNQDARTAEAALREGRADVARVAAEASASEDPGRADRWNLLGRALELNGMPSAASDAYAGAAARAPYDAAYWSNLARSRARQLLTGDASGGGAEAALDAAQRAVDADPNAPRPHVVFAEIASLSGAYELALGAAARAIRLHPGRHDYEDLAAAAALALSDPRAAIRVLEELIPLHDSATLRVALAKLSLQANDRESARRHASRAVELEPQNRDALAILSQIGG